MNKTEPDWASSILALFVAAFLIFCVVVVGTKAHAHSLWQPYEPPCRYDYCPEENTE